MAAAAPAAPAARSILTAAERGDLVQVQQLVEEDVALVRSKAELSGMTPLMWASKKGHLEVTRYLLDRGAKINATNNFGVTAMWYAAREARLAVVKLLLDKGAARSISENGWTALMWSAFHGHGEVVGYLVEEAGVDVDERDTEEGRTALWLAAACEHTVSADMPALSSDHRRRY
jgi:ankyrin repeat protein